MLAFYMSLVDREEEKSLVRALYEQHQQQMFKVAYSVLNNTHDAEDAVHESFIRVIDNISKISDMPVDKLGGYLVVIVKNISINIYSNNKSTVYTDDESFLDGLTDEDAYFDLESAIKVTNYIEALPERYSSLITLYLRFGYSLKDCAQLMGITNELAKKRFERAKKLLKEIIAAHNT